MGKIIELGERLRGQATAEPQLTLRQRLDREKKTRTQVIELLETAYSKFLALGERYQELAAAYQNNQRLSLVLAMHASGAPLLDAQGRLARDEVAVVIDQSIASALEGDRWDLTAEPQENGLLLVRIRRRLEDRPAEQKASSNEG